MAAQAETLYNSTCHDLNNLHIQTTLKKIFNQNHYTLYYYDRAGNLVRTVAPKGVKVDATFTRVDDHPDHDYNTNYRYNSLNQLIESQSPDQTTSTEYYYDMLGRLRFSQDARQKELKRFSYTKYDKLSRIIESGEFAPGIDDTSQAKITIKNMALTDNKVNTYPPSELILMKVHNYYTSAYTSIPTPYQGEEQKFLQNRISYSERYNKLGAGVSDPEKYKTTTIYSYNPHGDVTWVIQIVPTMLAELPPTTYSFIVSKIDYEYDLISGKVKKLIYNRNRDDEYYYKFIYDEDNRLRSVMTSRHDEIWDRDAEYTYYPHGPLRRIDLGEDKIQGIDYFYTINGWLKGINTLEFKPDGNHTDIGGDGSGTRSKIPKDAFGMQLRYYGSDYSGIGAPITETLPADRQKSLFNGNILSWQTSYNPIVLSSSQMNLTGNVMNNEGDIFRYDMLGRLISSDYMTKSGSNWNVLPNLNHSDYAYDANGNIKQLNRTSNTGAVIDNLTYRYAYGSDPQKDNRLRSIDDGITNKVLNDIADQADNNYTYDKAGNLTGDVSEQLSTISWTADGKVEKIVKNENHTEQITCNGVQQNLVLTGAVTTTFYYDSKGDRVAKYRDAQSIDNQILASCTVISEKSKLLEKYGSHGTYYVRDANGELLSIYEGRPAQPIGDMPGYLVNKEQLIYGSESHGKFASKSDKIPVAYTTNIAGLSIWKDFRRVGEKQYDIKDHLGNIRLTLNDYKLRQSTSPNSLFNPSASSLTNYYPYGMEQQERSKSSDSTRFGYNGMLKDNDIKGEGNSYTTESSDFIIRMK